MNSERINTEPAAPARQHTSSPAESPVADLGNEERRAIFPPLSRLDVLELAIAEIHFLLNTALLYKAAPDIDRIESAAYWAKETWDAR
jgi:hypothetical protein